MKVEISGDTSVWTEIRVESTNHDVIFDGWLQMEPDWWVLKRRVEGYGEATHRWAGRRDYLLVLADAIKFIAKANTAIAKEEGQ